MKQINGSPDDEVEVVIRKVFNSIMSALKKVFKGVHDDKLLIYNSQPWSASELSNEGAPMSRTRMGAK
jgi:hypothetical protein